MTYLKSLLTPEVLDSLRINLSVRDAKLRPEPSCDFCGDRTPVFAYHARRMADGVYPPKGAILYRWTACRECSAAVDAEDWNQMVTRMSKRADSLFTQMGLSKGVAVGAYQKLAEGYLKTFQKDAVENKE